MSFKDLVEAEIIAGERARAAAAAYDEDPSGDVGSALRASHDTWMAARRAVIAAMDGAPSPYANEC